METQRKISDKLASALQPSVLNIVNESHMHSVPANSETHFNVTVVAEAFEGLRSVQRHQKIYQLLSEELAGPVHALALHTYSPKEWSQQPDIAPSPDCASAKK